MNAQSLAEPRDDETRNEAIRYEAKLSHNWMRRDAVSKSGIECADASGWIE
jgi:hypothetical protein